VLRLIRLPRSRLTRREIGGLSTARQEDLDRHPDGRAGVNQVPKSGAAWVEIIRNRWSSDTRGAVEWLGDFEAALTPEGLCRPA